MTTNALAGLPKRSDILLAIGDPCPDFSLPASGDQSLGLADFAGQPLVIFFYPRDDTSGCTKESIGFSEALDAFKTLNCAVLGVSKDSVKSHDKFIAKHDLTVPLVSDENGHMCEDFGVWVEKSMYGKTFMGIERASFLIRPDGTVAQIWRKVKVAGHVDAVLDAVKTL